MYSAETHYISVTVVPEYIAREADPARSRYFWAYHITIKNNGAKAVKLLSRYWKITDGHGKAQEVRGEGVVGKTPILKPGEEFKYTSGCPLSTRSGIMSGSYHMQARDGELIDVEIPTFSLDIPDQQVTLN